MGEILTEVPEMIDGNDPSSSLKSSKNLVESTNTAGVNNQSNENKNIKKVQTNPDAQIKSSDIKTISNKSSPPLEPSSSSINKTSSSSISSAEKPKVKKVVKPPKLEDKPFEEFINDHLIPTLTESLKIRGVLLEELELNESERPVVGGNCWILRGNLSGGRMFWLCFSEKQIGSTKTFSLAETGSKPTLLESFLIDEKKTTLALLVSRLLQRLNGQKWLAAN